MLSCLCTYKFPNVWAQVVWPLSVVCNREDKRLCHFSSPWLVRTNQFSFTLFKSYSCYRVALCFRITQTSDSTNLRQGCCLLSAWHCLKHVFEIYTSLRLLSVFSLGWHGKERHTWCTVTSLPPSSGQKAGSAPNEASLLGSRQSARLQGGNEYHIPQLDWWGTVTANIDQSFNT